jgi:hypothetical protein
VAALNAGYDGFGASGHPNGDVAGFSTNATGVTGSFQLTRG